MLPSATSGLKRKKSTDRLEMHLEAATICKRRPAAAKATVAPKAATPKVMVAPTEDLEGGKGEGDEGAESEDEALLVTDTIMDPSEDEPEPEAALAP
jgi:hypothetical protein